MPVNRSILTCICTGVALASLSTAQARDLRNLNIYVRTPDGSPSQAAVVHFLSASGEMVSATPSGDSFIAENVGSKLVIEVSHPNFGVATVYGILGRDQSDNWVGVSFVSPNTARLLTPGQGANATAATRPGSAILGPCPAAGGCCVAHGTPGCDDADCCSAVCGLDPFCCNNSWDIICAGESCSNFPGVCDCCPDPPTNDACVDRLPIFDGTTPFSNVGTTTDGPSPCGGLGSDIWYNYTATCTGEATVSTCPPNGGATYDSAIAAYDGCDCPVGAPLACNDDFCGLQTQISFPVTAGNCYKIQVGGFNGSQGSGTINITCGVPCDDLACPPGSLIEPEPCLTDFAIDDTNGGCNSSPPVFTNAACGDTWCGTGSTYLSDLGETRDTDWYLVCHGGGPISATLTSEFPAVVFIVDGIGVCAPVIVGVTGSSDNCLTGPPASADLPAGQYVVFVAPSVFNGIPCDGTNDYYVTISCAAGGCQSDDDCPPGSFCENGCCLPTGACCFGDGGCLDGLPASECVAQGGTYQGDNTQCGVGPGSNCCIANGGLGCDDPECQAIVCAADAFCCETSWDSICADLAQQLCGDLCASVFCQAICGPGAGPCCSANGGLGCEDTDCCLAVCAIDPFCCEVSWDGLCAGEALQFPLECDRSNCIPCTCGDPGAGDCCVPHATPCCSDADCCTIVCGIDPFCCSPAGTWDITCAGEAANLCGDFCPPPPCPGAPFACGQPGTGPCEVPGGVPGCNDCDCCSTVCAIDPFCCDVAWDGICATEAQQFCGEPCDAPCPPGSLIEPEPCLTDGAIDDTNGGCNSSPAVYTNAACGDTWCGTGSTYLSDLGDTRDTDWYLLCHGGGNITATLTSEFPAVVFILDGIAECAPVVVGQAGNSSNCVPGLPASADLPAGQYVVFVAPSIFTGIPCGGNLGNDYQVTISCAAGGCNSDADCPPGEICVNGCCVPAPPSNDLCDDAISLNVAPGGSVSIAGTNEAATNEGTPACSGNPLPQVGPGVWYSVIGNGNTITASTCPPPGGSNCCFPNGGLGCDDPECQAIVCGVDAFCCEVAWDGLCAAQAAELCGDLCPPASFDTMLTVFCGDCPGSLCIVGNDDFCGLQSSVTWCANDGSNYLILVHGFAGQVGNFTLNVSDNNVPCVPTVDCPLSCFQIISESTECIGASGDFNYHVVGINTCTNSPITLDFVASGGDVGEQMCFEISLFDNNGDLCCNATVCTTIPDCTPSGQPCDLDGDQMIGVTDMLILLAAWNSNPGGPPDYDGDGTVAVSDFLYLLANWGPCQ